MTDAEAHKYAHLSHYDRLIETGAIGSLKRDALLDATCDVRFLDHIQAFFARESGGSPADVAPCTVRLIRELIAEGFVTLCTWGKDGAHQPLQKTDDELVMLVASLEAHPFEFFLHGTQAGMDWVVRYRRLVGELR